MLSIGRVGGGHGDPRYYIDSVAKGREDYYTGEGEADGEWYGSGAQAKGLSHTVSEGDFLGVLQVEPGSRQSVLGFDLTFSAPKSVSGLYGTGDSEIARKKRWPPESGAGPYRDVVGRSATALRREGKRWDASGGRVRLRC